MSKKMVVIIGAIVLSAIAIVLIILFNGSSSSKQGGGTKESEEKNQIIIVAEGFSTARYNYNDMTDDGYMEAMQPFMTESFYTDEYRLARIRAIDPSAKIPLSSRIAKQEVVSFDSLKAEVTQEIETSTNNSDELININVRLNLVKVYDNWFVDGYTEKKVD